MKTLLNLNLRAFLSMALFLSAVSPFAANYTQTVTQVSGTVSLTTNVDYVITSEEPFADGAVLDIVNTENAVVILQNLRPSEAAAHLDHIRINGAKAVKNSNCMLKMYVEGCIILPHGSGIKPLTVYTGEDWTGESAQFAVGTRQSLEYHAMNNKIQSFTLKRGYMAWFGTRSSTTDPGYNRVFIADKADIKIKLPAILSNSISALRVSQWNDASKKGFCSWQQGPNELLNTTWHYNWDAGNNPSDDREYVTQQHHRDKSSGYWWPSFTEVGNNGTSANVVTYNEPDNTGDDREHPATVQQVLDIWPQLMATGRRLGSPAMAGNLNWLYEFMDSIDARGWRCDFVVMHCYWYSDWSSWNGTLSGVKNRTGRPIWITEMNYGANWTGWPGSNRDANDANYAIHKQHFAPIIDGLEATSWLERYCVYNAVEPCRSVIDDNGKLTPSGEYYANKKSGMAYNSSYNVIPKLPKMKDPTGFTVHYDGKNTTATMTWREYNGEYNTSMVVQRRKTSSSPWETIATITPKEKAADYVYRDSTALNGYYYRVNIVDVNGDERTTRSRQAVLEKVEAGDRIQVNGEVKYAGGNAFVNGDFDFGGLGWTDGQGNSVDESGYFSVFSMGGMDGGAYLYARGHTTSANGAEALKGVVDIIPGKDYYFSASLINGSSAFHRLNLTGDDTKTDSIVLLLTTSSSWANQAFSFKNSTFPQAMFSGYRMNGKTQLDKVLLCALYDTEAEAMADGVIYARKKAEIAGVYLNKYPVLQAELAATVSSITGTDEVAFLSINQAINDALQGARDKYSLDSLSSYVESVIALQLDGHEELSAVLEEAKNAAKANEYAEALVAMRVALDEYLPMVYANDYIQAYNFNGSSVGWTTKCGTYKGGDQRVNLSMAGKSCWNAWWSGLDAAEGSAKTMEIKQQLTRLSHGVYALECKAGTEYNCLSDQHAYMQYGEDTLSSNVLTYARLDLPSVADSSKWETLVTPPVYVEDNGALTIGFIGSKEGAVNNAWKEIGNLESLGDKREGWWCATDFRLRYLPMYRTIVPEGGWGVICLPRAMTVASHVKLYHAEGILADYSALCLQEVEEAEAGVPYIYYTDKPEIIFYEFGEEVDLPSFEDPIFGDFIGNWPVFEGCYFLNGTGWKRTTADDVVVLPPYSGFINSALDFKVYDSWAGQTMPIHGAAEEKAQKIHRIDVEKTGLFSEDGLYMLDGRQVVNGEAKSGSVYIQVRNGEAKKIVYRK